MGGFSALEQKSHHIEGRVRARKYVLVSLGSGLCATLTMETITIAEGTGHDDGAWY